MSALDSDQLIGLMQALECGKGTVYLRGPRLVAPWFHPLGHLVDMSCQLEQGVRLRRASLCSPVQRGQKSHLPGLGWQCIVLRAPSAWTGVWRRERGSATLAVRTWWLHVEGRQVGRLCLLAALLYASLSSHSSCSDSCPGLPPPRGLLLERTGSRQAQEGTLSSPCGLEISEALGLGRKQSGRSWHSREKDLGLLRAVRRGH